MPANAPASSRSSPKPRPTARPSSQGGDGRPQDVPGPGEPRHAARWRVLDTAETKWEKAYAETEPAYLQVLRDRPNEAPKLRLLMDYVQGKAEERDFPAALAGLQKLNQVLSKSPTTSTPGGNPSRRRNQRATFDVHGVFREGPADQGPDQTEVRGGNGRGGRRNRPSLRSRTRRKSWRRPWKSGSTPATRCSARSLQLEKALRDEDDPDF